jgi:GrpB-like predicted nucleotidyltransferase (UPF0157 family)
MILESQEKYLATLPEGKVVITKPFDPKVQEMANKLVKRLENLLPNVPIRFHGSAALGIAGQNDIDIIVLTMPEEYEKYEVVLAPEFGVPTKKKTISVKWEFVQDGFVVEISLVNRDAQSIQEQLRVFEILSHDEKLRKEYEQLKLPFGPIDFKEYMRMKYAFYNKTLGIQ